MAPSAANQEISNGGKAEYNVDSFEAATAIPQKVIDSLVRNGGCFLRNLIAQEDLNKIENDVRVHLEESKVWKGDFFPAQTQKVTGLGAKSETFMTSIANNSLYMDVCNHFLSHTHEAWVGDEIETSVSKPQLNATVVFSIKPGARAQALHRDDSVHHNNVPAITLSEYVPGRDTSIGLFVAGKKTTKANGATRFVPGSHLQATSQKPDEAGVVYAELDPGDAFLMLSSCYHAGSKNTTENEERLLYCSFMTRGYLRQEENQYLAVPISKVKTYPKAIQDLLGYTVSAPFCGWIDLQNPRKALDDDIETDDLF